MKGPHSTVIDIYYTKHVETVLHKLINPPEAAKKSSVFINLGVPGTSTR